MLNDFSITESENRSAVKGHEIYVELHVGEGGLDRHPESSLVRADVGSKGFRTHPRGNMAGELRGKVIETPSSSA